MVNAVRYMARSYNGGIIRTGEAPAIPLSSPCRWGTCQATFRRVRTHLTGSHSISLEQTVAGLWPARPPCHDDRDHDDGERDQHPVLTGNAQYRRIPDKPLAH
jgi:hypothetical protein